MAESKWQRANGRGHLAQRAFRRGLLEEGFWMRAIFREGSYIWRAFGKELLEKGFWKRANFWRAIGMHPVRPLLFTILRDSLYQIWTKCP